MASQQSREVTAQGQENQRDTLHLKEFLSEAIFYQEFDNTLQPRRTVLCFGLRKAGHGLWDLWGYTFNNPGREHAERLAIQALSDFLTPRRLCMALRYQLVLYLSYSPCEDCCCELLAFVKSLKVVEIDVMVSRLYCHEQLSVRKGLQDLMASGVRLSVMDEKDFEHCLYLFVDPNSRFKPWPDLGPVSKSYSMDLHSILHECDGDCGLKPENAARAGMESSPFLSALAVCGSRGLQEPRTPQKQSRVSKCQEDPQGTPVKRRLFKDK